MENVTHSLIGIILGEGIARRARLGNGPARRAVLWTSLLASNLPDFDFLMRPFVGGGLGYLLHHRGYTHSIALSVPLALIAAGVGRLVARQSVPWKPLLAAGWLGVLMHIGADFWNDYGVHPFWPLSNRWFYGDVVFIIEPLLWMTMLPFVFHISRTVSARVVCAILVLGILGVMFFRQDVPVAVAVFSMLWACGAFAVYRSLARRPRAGVLSGLLGVLLILVIFSGFSAFARHRILDAMPAGERVLQLASSPAPGNPLCWRLIVTSVTESGEYRARIAVLGLAPPGFAAAGFRPWDPERCFLRRMTEHTAELAEVSAPGLLVLEPGVRWYGEFQGRVDELAELARTNCRIRALLRFVRMPFWRKRQHGSVIAGDLRYDDGHGGGFASVESWPAEACLENEPPWEMPSGVFKQF